MGKIQNVYSELATIKPGDKSSVFRSVRVFERRLKLHEHLEKYPYEVTIQHCMDYPVMLEWARENNITEFDSDETVMSFRPSIVAFWFTHADDAMRFKLTWYS